MSFIISLISNLLLWLLLLFQTRHSNSNTEGSNERNYTNIILLIGILVFVVSTIISWNDYEDRAKDTQTATKTLNIADSINFKMVTIDTLSKNLENLKLLNDKLFNISEKTKNVIFEREKSLEDYNKLSINLENYYKSDFDSYKEMIKCLFKDKKIYITVIDSLLKENNNMFQNLEGLKVKYNSISQRVVLSDLELIELDILANTKKIEQLKKSMGQYEKFMNRIIDKNLRKFYDSGKSHDLRRYIEFEVSND